MNGWETMTLAKAGVRLIDCVHKTPEAQPFGYPYVAIPQMKEGRIQFTDARRISETDYREWTKKAKPQKHDVILSRRTNPGIIAIDSTGTEFALGQNLVLLRADGKRVLPEYLRWLCLSKEWWRQIEKFINVGAVFSSLRCADVPSFELPIPPKSEQEIIAATLASLDDKIELNRRMNETLEALAQAIFKDWFVDFGPTRRKSEGATDPVAILGNLIPDPARAQETAALFPATFGDDGLPEGWKSHKLEALASLSKASASPSKSPDQLFEHHSLPAYDKGEEPVLEQGSAILSNKFAVPENAVLLSKLNPEISRVWVPNPRRKHQQIASTEFLVLVPTEGVGRSLLCAIFRDPSFRSGLEGMVTGTSKSHQRISPPALMDKEIVHGAFDIFKEFGALATPLLDKRLALRAESRTLAETRDYLLPKLMSGEVRVRDAEKIAG